LISMKNDFATEKGNADAASKTGFSFRLQA
jgi:hypothetical protein